MRGKKFLAAAAAAAGLALALCGLFVITDPVLKSVSGLCIGIGSAAFALGLGNLILLVTVPQAELARRQAQKDIEVNDERNISIREKAGAAANRVIFYALCAAVLAFGMLGDITAVFVVIGILALEFALIIGFTSHYSKRI